jgi:hypothetical protein
MITPPAPRSSPADRGPRAHAINDELPLVAFVDQFLTKPSVSIAFLGVSLFLASSFVALSRWAGGRTVLQPRFKRQFVA